LFTQHQVSTCSSLIHHQHIEASFIAHNRKKLKTFERELIGHLIELHALCTDVGDEPQQAVLLSGPV
jgi:hypothetical protein